MDYAILNYLTGLQTQLMGEVPHGIRPEIERARTAGLGVIEETLEYLNALGHKPWRPNPQPEHEQLEELVDILHFYLELVILSKFTWGQIVGTYEMKHAKNLDRYKRAKKGDFSWNDRGKGQL